MEKTTTRKILVVDDSATMRMFLSMTLKKIAPGITIIEAVNGSDGLAKMETHNFDLILTDMIMPEMDGLQMIGRIRGRLSGTMPIVIITSKGEERERDLGISSGANGYITKPVDIHELRETVFRFLMKGGSYAGQPTPTHTACG